MRTQWTAYQVDKSVEPIFEELEKHKYRLHVTLIGKTNNLIAEDERQLKDDRDDCSSLYHAHPGLSIHNFDAYFLAPFLWSDRLAYLERGDSCPAMPAQEFRISVPVNDLPDVTRATATIELIKEPQK